MSNLAFGHVISLHEICDIQIMLWQRVHAIAHELQQPGTTDRNRDWPKPCMTRNLDTCSGS
eukprot:3646603-Karenia_brevis.AAC.1